MDTVDTNYLADFGYTRDEVLAENDVEFNSLEEMGTKHEELILAILCLMRTYMLWKIQSIMMETR